MIDIGTEATGLLVAEVGESGPPRVVADRSHRIEVGAATLGALSSLILAEAEVARDLGAEHLLAQGAESLRGTREARVLGRACGAVGTAGLRLPSGRQRAELAFRGATHGLQRELPDSVAVVHSEADSTGIAIGRPGSSPAWVAHRRVGPRLLARRARFGEQPTEDQVAAARGAAGRALGAIIAPPHEASLMAPAPLGEQPAEATEAIADALAEVLEVEPEPAEFGVREGLMMEWLASTTVAGDRV